MVTDVNTENTAGIFNVCLVDPTQTIYFLNRTYVRKNEKISYKNTHVMDSTFLSHLNSFALKELFKKKKKDPAEA